MGGPGSDVPEARSCESRYDPSESVLVALGIKGPAVGVGPAEVDRRVYSKRLVDGPGSTSVGMFGVVVLGGGGGRLPPSCDVRLS